MASPNPRMRTNREPPGGQRLVALTSLRDLNRIGSSGRALSVAQEVQPVTRETDGT